MNRLALSSLLSICLFAAITGASQEPAPAPAPAAPQSAQTAENNQTIALAQVLNVYSEEQLLFSLLQASPFGGNRSATDLAYILWDIPVEKRNELKKKWFVFLLNRFTLAEIKQMREWQTSPPKSQSLVLKIVAQVAVSDTEMLGELMGMVPNAANVR